MQFSGIVQKGKGYGRELGFPTVNIITREVLPMGLEEGVYAGTAMLDGKEYRAGIVVGPGEIIEAHLIGYEGNAYGKLVSLEIKQFLRDFITFENKEDLMKQIEEDLKKC